MFSLRRPSAPAPVAEAPAPLPPASLAARAAAGSGGGSGTVEPWRALQNGYQNGAVISELVGHQTVTGVGSVQQLADLPPQSVYADRPLYGGVRTAPSFGEYQAEQFVTPGGIDHQVLGNRPPMVLVESDQMSPQEWVAPTEWRDAPSVVDLCRRVPTSDASGFTGKAGVN